MLDFFMNILSVSPMSQISKYDTSDHRKIPQPTFIKPSINSNIDLTQHNIPPP